MENHQTSNGGLERRGQLLGGSSRREDGSYTGAKRLGGPFGTRLIPQHNDGNFRREVRLEQFAEQSVRSRARAVHDESVRLMVQDAPSLRIQVRTRANDENSSRSEQVLKPCAGQRRQSDNPNANHAATELLAAALAPSCTLTRRRCA